MPPEGRVPEIAVILGSVTKPGRLRRALAAAIEAADGANAELFDLGEHTVAYADGADPDSLGDDTGLLVGRIAAADAVVFATPVYRGSLSGSLKNLIDHTPLPALAGKPVGIVAMGGSDHHFLGVERHLRDILAFFGARTAPLAVYINSADFDEAGEPGERALDGARRPLRRARAPGRRLRRPRVARMSSATEYTYATEEMRLPAESVSALVVDAHEPSRLGLGLVLRRAPWVRRVHLAADSGEGAILAGRHHPDVAVLDVSETGPLAGGVVARLREAHPGVGVVLSSRCRTSLGAPPASLGALGFVPAGSSTDAVLASCGAALVTGEPVEPAPVPIAADGLAGLSEREREILGLLSTGATNREIAERLHLGPDSVKKSATALYRKLGVRNRTEAAQRAEAVLGGAPVEHAPQRGRLAPRKRRISPIG